MDLDRIVHRRPLPPGPRLPENPQPACPVRAVRARLAPVQSALARPEARDAYTCGRTDHNPLIRPARPWNGRSLSTGARAEHAGMTSAHHLYALPEHRRLD